jgi:hypothetical protein
MLQSDLKMVKISKDIDRVPSWLRLTKTHVPDFVAEDPEVNFILAATMSAIEELY